MWPLPYTFPPPCRHPTMCGGEDDHLMLPLQEPFKPPPVRLDSSGARVYSVAKEELNKITEEVPPLFQAIQGHVDGLVELLDLLRQNPESVHLRHDQDTPLHAACHAHNLPALTELLVRGAQVEVLDGQGNTALHVAVREGWHEGVEELLRRGASPNTKSQPPPACKQYPVETPFHAAVRRGDNVSTTLILQYRPDFCLKDNEHCSVLHLAVQTHNITLLRRLLQEKSCSDTFAAVDVRGNTVLHTALSRKCSEDELHILEIIKDLVGLGLNLNVSNQMGETPLFLALRMRLTRVVKWLLSRGSDPRSINYQDQTVLHAACEAGSALSLKHLLSVYGLNNLLFAADKEGHEPFHMAVFSGSLECCEILLDNGDHLTIRDREGRSRFSYVIEYLPMASRLLTRVFDSRIRLVNEPADNPEFNVTLDYSVLMSRHDQECCIVPELAKSSLHALLLHPLVESFLYFKLWILNYLRFFNCNCVTTGAKFTTNKAIEQGDSTERWSRNFDSDYSHLTQLRTEVREPQGESEGEEEETFVKRETLQLVTAERNFKRSDFPLSSNSYQFAGESLTSFIDESSNNTTLRGRRSFGGTFPAQITQPVGAAAVGEGGRCGLGAIAGQEPPRSGVRGGEDERLAKDLCHNEKGDPRSQGWSGGRGTKSSAPLQASLVAERGSRKIFYHEGTEASSVAESGGEGARVQCS
ncbi:hypothetical protein C7M84_022153 [Penaeus vannamei]|uniref:Uncharacterized protein n=1 Tax=Penaeus vannamei TaxID=6689 RepID=A0A3R7QZE4_PENVA|nr:hypothetical protein C7M84_022153 [Penaeus vannamei]